MKDFLARFTVAAFMEFWERFIESLASAGGSVFLLVLLVILFARAEIHLAYHPDGISQNLTVTLSNILMAFVGALVQALQSRAKPPNGNGSGDAKPPEIPVAPDAPKV